MPRTVRFEVSSAPVQRPAGARNRLELTLIRQSWDDYGFRTSFELWWVDPDTPVFLGTVKIGREGMDASFGGRIAHTPLEDSFFELDGQYLSLGQDASYYERIVEQFGAQDGRAVLTALQDLTLDLDRLENLEFERVLRKSIMRVVKWTTVQEQYRRIVLGGMRREPFTLTYSHEPERGAESPTTTFHVSPRDAVPGTLQVVIGSNGAGKTRMLKNISGALDSATQIDPWHVQVSDGKRLSGLVTVSFSAFDIFPPRDETSDEFSPFRIKHLGLSVLSREDDAPSHERDGAAQVAAFQELVDACQSAGRSERLLKAVSTLCEADLILDEYDLDSVASMMALPFEELSSGHKIVLLTAAGLVKNCDDATLILLDEPESHLHPPLLSAFMRAVGDLVAETNSLAIVATHSPVVLQQVPRRHARKIWRRGSRTQFLPMSVETFGENLGTLTREVFGVELERSGHYALLVRAADEGSYSDAVGALGGSIGEEAKMILRALLAERAERV